MDPTLGGFVEFVTGTMGVPSGVINPANPPNYVTWAYDFALNFVNQALQCVPNAGSGWSLYAVAVYNLAGDTLINFGMDNSANTPPTYWATLRAQYGTNNFVAGVVQSSGDEGTNSSYAIPKGFENYTIANLQNLKTPYGRQYLGIAQSWGTVWGLT